MEELLDFKNFKISGDDELNLYYIGTMIYSTLVYWLVGGIFTIFDLTLLPKALRKYKVQPETNEPLDKDKLKMVR